MYALRLDLRQRSDRGVVLDQRAAADHDVVADRAALADAGLVADDHTLADRRAGEDDRAGRDDRARAELERRQLLTLGGRARRQGRLLADDGVVEDLAALPDHRPRKDDRGLGDLSHAGGCDGARPAAARARGEHDRRSAVLGDLGGVALAGRGSERKCLHSSRSSCIAARDLRAVDVARPPRPLAVGLGRLPRALTVDRHLALQLHVVEHHHLLLPDDGDLPHLVAGRARRGAGARSCRSGSAGSRRRRPRRRA